MGAVAKRKVFRVHTATQGDSLTRFQLDCGAQFTVALNGFVGCHGCAPEVRVRVTVPVIALLATARKPSRLLHQQEHQYFDVGATT